MRNLNSSFKESDLVERLDIGGKSSMNTEDTAFNHCTDAEVIENFSAVLPGVCVAVLPDDFVVKTVDRCDLTCFVITSQ